MTQQDLIEKIRRLSIVDRLALIEDIARSLREELKTNDSEEAAVSPSDDQNERAIKSETVRLLRGILKFDGDPPTDEEVKEARADYLQKKYS